MDDILEFLLYALYYFIVILKEKSVQLAKFRDIYGKKVLQKEKGKRKSHICYLY